MNQSSLMQTDDTLNSLFETMTSFPMPTTPTYDFQMNQFPPFQRKRSDRNEVHRPDSGYKEDKIYKCHKPNCTKVYKNMNGLRYHLEKGICELELSESVSGIDNMAPVKVIQRPYFCRVGGCTKKYKNMNGLKYHAKVAHGEMDFCDLKGINLMGQ